MRRRYFAGRRSVIFSLPSVRPLVPLFAIRCPPFVGRISAGSVYKHMWRPPFAEDPSVSTGDKFPAFQWGPNIYPEMASLAPPHALRSPGQRLPPRGSREDPPARPPGDDPPGHQPPRRGVQGDQPGAARPDPVPVPDGRGGRPPLRGGDVRARERRVLPASPNGPGPQPGQREVLRAHARSVTD